MKSIRPWGLTWNDKISNWEKKFVLTTIILLFHVKLEGCIWLYSFIVTGWWFRNPAITILCKYYIMYLEGFMHPRWWFFHQPYCLGYPDTASSGRLWRLGRTWATTCSSVIVPLLLALHPGRLTAGTYSHHLWKERNMIWTKPPWVCSMLIFRGVHDIRSLSTLPPQRTPVRNNG